MSDSQDQDRPGSGGAEAADRIGVPLPPVSKHLAHVWAALESEVSSCGSGGGKLLGREMLHVSTLVRDFRAVAPCLRADGLLKWLVHAKLAADRLHALDIASQVHCLKLA